MKKRRKTEQQKENILKHHSHDARKPCSRVRQQKRHGLRKRTKVISIIRIFCQRTIKLRNETENIPIVIRMR